MPERYNRATMPPIMPDLIPASSWGSSLANLLTTESWNSIRQPVIERWGGSCQIDGTPRKQLDVHEIWAYSPPPPDAPEGMCGVQRLIGLAGLCRHCHEFFHPGLARVRNRELVVRLHLQAINQWSEAEYWSHHREMERRWLARSERMWALDLSLVRFAGPLVVDSARGWRLEADGMTLTRIDPNLNDQNWTVAFGAPMILDGRLLPAPDPAEVYSGLLPEGGDFNFVLNMGNGVDDAPRSIRRPMTAGVPHSPRPAPDPTPVLEPAKRSWFKTVRETVRAMY